MGYPTTLPFNKQKLKAMDISTKNLAILYDVMEIRLSSVMLSCPSDQACTSCKHSDSTTNECYRWVVVVAVIGSLSEVHQMDENQWMYDSIISEEVDMDDENEQECGVNEQHVDCSDAFNTSQVFVTRDDVLQWARSVAHENGFMVVIMRSDTNTDIRGMTSFVLIGCEMSGQYRSRKKDFVRRDTGSRKFGCPFKLRGKPLVGGQGMTFSAGFAYLKGERFNNVVSHDKNVKAKCKFLIGQKNAWEYVMDAWGNATNNMITLQHREIKASFETSTHVVGHVFKVTLYKRLLGIVSRYALNQIAAEYECVHYAGKNSSRCGCVMRTTHKKHQKSTKRDPSYWKYVDALHFVQNSNSSVKRSASSSDQPIPRRIMPMLDQFHSFIHDFTDNIVDAKADGNCGYRAIAALLGMREDSWSLVCNHLLKELGKWSDDYIKLFGSTDRLKEIRRSLLVIMDKWMDITEMRYIIASRYNVILVSLSLQQNMTFFPLRSQLPTYSFVHRIICISHVYDNHFVQV
ncbi:hypothetical protein HKD37_04G009716 [Glycine soja]